MYSEGTSPGIKYTSVHKRKEVLRKEFINSVSKLKKGGTGERMRLLSGLLQYSFDQTIQK
jgi:hypothetical protein